MRFESIDITNFRQYKKVHFDFLKKGKSDIHLIIASNGVGKTNLLNAINWCLYGDEPHTSGTNNPNDKDKLPICNLEAIEEAKKYGEYTCDVEVKITASEKDVIYEINRKVNISTATRDVTGKDEFEICSISSLGGTNFYKDEQAKEIVNKYLPQKIREYFYFDGERLLNYFDDDVNKTRHIKDSIYEIAQVNVINDSITHLGIFETDYNKKIKNIVPEVESKQKAIKDAEDNIREFKKQISDLEMDIDKSNKGIFEAESLITGSESIVEDNNRYERNVKEIERIEEEIGEKKAILTKFVRKYLILLMLFKTNRSTSEYIAENTQVDDNVFKKGVDVIKASVDAHQCKICGNHLSHELEKKLELLVLKYMTNKTINKLFEIKNDINKSLNIDAYKQEKKEIYKSLMDLENNKTTLINENDVLKKKISSVSDIASIENAMNKKEHLRESIKRSNQKIGAYGAKIDDLKKDLERLQKEYLEAIEKNKKCEELRKHLNLVDKAKSILNIVQKEIVEDVKSKMEVLTMKVFNSLLWKKDTYDRIRLEDNFRLKLYHKHQNISCLNSCSAAEKELLALAFTIALHKVSGYDSLLFIDTPVGRVSDENRENFAKVLLEISSNKQIILAFTPSEYSDEISSIFSQNIVSSINRLEKDEKMVQIEGKY